MITNSRSQRFDVYSGPFTKNDLLTTSPYTDLFFFVPDVTFSVAIQVLPALNNLDTNQRRAFEVLEESEKELYARGYVDTVYRRWLEEMDRRNEIERRAAMNLTLGYVTTDVGSTSLFSNCRFHLIGVLIVLSRSGRRCSSYSSSVPPCSRLHRFCTAQRVQ